MRNLYSLFTAIHLIQLVYYSVRVSLSDKLNFDDQALAYIGILLAICFAVALRTGLNYETRCSQSRISLAVAIIMPGLFVFHIAVLQFMFVSPSTLGFATIVAYVFGVFLPLTTLIFAVGSFFYRPYVNKTTN